MGCNECKQKKEQQGSSESETINIPLIPEAIVNGQYNGNFLFKLVTFGVIIIAIPFIIVILICQMFLTFFLPNSVTDVTSVFINFIKKIIEKYGMYKAKRELKRRAKEFSNTTSYDDYDVYDTKQYIPEEILTDVENLNWVNLSNLDGKIDNKDNNKKANDE
jgi:hypothetical protein